MAVMVTHQLCQVMTDARAVMAKFLKDQHKGYRARAMIVPAQSLGTAS